MIPLAVMTVFPSQLAWFPPEDSTAKDFPREPAESRAVSPCVVDLDFFFFLVLFLPIFSISIWTSFVSSCLFLVGTMLSPRFPILLRLV